MLHVKQVKQLYSFSTPLMTSTVLDSQLIKGEEGLFVEKQTPHHHKSAHSCYVPAP